MNTRHRILALVLSVMLAACGGARTSAASGDSAGQPPTAPGGPAPGDGTPDQPGWQPTAVGRPIGPEARALIGSAGGSVVAPDGQATLEIPPGALTGDTEISLQSVTNEAPSGRVAAYRFGPDGLQFQMPARLHLRGLAAGEMGALSLVTQDGQGGWSDAAEPVAAAEGELVFALPHFSDWAFFERWTLAPATGDVVVGETIALRAWEWLTCAYVKPCTPGGPLLGRVVAQRWTVNGVEGGNASLGRLVPRLDGAGVDYVAPATPPAANPVSIAASVQTPRGVLMLVSQVRVLPRETAWTGEIKVDFYGAHRTTDGLGVHNHQLALSTTHRVKDLMVFSEGDEESGMAVLTLGPPEVSFAEGWHDVLGDDESVEGLLRSRVADAACYGTPLCAPKMTLTLYRDGSAVLVPELRTRFIGVGQVKSRHLVGGSGPQRHETTVTALQGPYHGGDLLTVVTGAHYRNPITLEPMLEVTGGFEGRRVPADAARRIHQGRTEIDGVSLGLEEEGDAVPGRLVVEWSLTRHLR